MTGPTISANRITPEERAMKDTWNSGPVPPENRRIQALEQSNAILRRSLKDETGKQATAIHLARLEGMCIGALIVVLVGIAI